MTIHRRRSGGRPPLPFSFRWCSFFFLFFFGPTVSWRKEEKRLISRQRVKRSHPFKSDRGGFRSQTAPLWIEEERNRNKIYIQVHRAMLKKKRRTGDAFSRRLVVLKTLQRDASFYFLWLFFWPPFVYWHLPNSIWNNRNVAGYRPAVGRRAAALTVTAAKVCRSFPLSNEFLKKGKSW